MKRFANSLLVIIMILCASCQKEAQNVVKKEGQKEVQLESSFVPGTVLVQFDEPTINSLEKQPITKGALLTKTGVLSVDNALSSL